MPTTWEKTKALLGRELNFYRIHLLAFIFVSIFYHIEIYVLMSDPIILLRSNVWDQYRISDPIH